MGIFLVAMPFLFYAYRFVPETLTQIELFGRNFNAGSYGNFHYYAYYFITKFVFFIAFFIWFVTCRHWWRMAILVPITMLLFQLLGVVNASINYLDEFDFWYSLPVVVPCLAALLLLDRKLRPLAQTLDLKDEIDKEINEALNN